MRLRVTVLITVCMLGACQQDGKAPAGRADGPPNILLILVDDMGYGDLGANTGPGGVSLTPRLDTFAAQGVRFTRHYVDSTCAATRAGILTGTAPVARGFRPAGLGISPEVDTLPEQLRSLGYTTHHVGKWHLGYASRLAWPTAQGFDEFYGFLSQFLLRGPHPAGELRFARPTYIDPWLQSGDAFPVQHNGHLSDLLLARVVDFLEAADRRDKPWFLNYWTFLPHKPLQPARRFAEQFPPDSAGRYRAMISQLDALVGTVLDKLEERGLADSTLVMIASDNGGAQVALGSNLPFAGGKMSFQEGGVRTPLLIRWPRGKGAGTTLDEIVSYLDYLPTLVSVAGGVPPVDLPGRDISTLLDGVSLPRRSLFWESGNSGAISWSVLSEDGRWRLHRFFGAAPVLNALDEDPAGGVDVADEYPVQVAALLAEYRDWRELQRKLKVHFEGESTGHGQLTGEALQRAPGFGGFSFAIGLTPGPAAHSAEDQVIALQQQMWQMRQVGTRLLLQVGDVHLEAPAPDMGRCTSVVVSTQFSYNRISPGKARAHIALFMDGKLAARTEVRRPALPADNFSVPTYIGRDAAGGRRYRGALSMPVVLNEPLLEEPDPWAQNGVATLDSQLCGE